MADNKIKYGLSNVHIAPITAYNATTGTYTYGTPVLVPGAVNVSLKKAGSTDPFYADDVTYKNLYTNQGYDGDIEFALIPDDIRKMLFNETDTNGIMIENADSQPIEFALQFEFAGDVKKKRYTLYRCQADRPDIESHTKEDKISATTEKLTLKAMPRENDHVVRAVCPQGNASYANWYNSIVEPTSFAECRLSALSATGLTLVPTFDSDEYSYTATGVVGSSTVTATAKDAEATVTLKLGTTTLTDGAATLVEGANTITAVVTNGTNTATYTIVATCTAS